MTESQILLAEYAENGSEAAFRELARRYIDFVYSAAARLVEGAPHLAEDVTQIVFADLARKARSLSREIMLGGWLHRRTCHVAATLMRGERRRQHRERQAAAMNSSPDHDRANLAQVAPILDDAINHLGAEDRTAIVLRFFERRDLRAVGEALGSNEDAARKRVSRALEKLQVLLKNRGVVLSAGALAAGLGAGAVSAAPVELAGAVAGSAMAAATAGVGTTFTLVNIMAATKLKITAAGAVILAGLLASVVVQQKAAARIQSDEAELRRQSVELARLQSDTSHQTEPPAKGPTPADEILRLRAEVTDLQARTNAFAALQTQSRQLKQSVRAEAEQKPPLLIQAEAMTRLNASKQYALAFRMYADDHDGRFPTNFDQADAIFATAAGGNLKAATNQFDIVYQGTLAAVTNAGDVMVLREKEAWPDGKGQWGKIYAYMDGHCEIKKSPDGDFSEWERQHIIPPAQ